MDQVKAFLFDVFGTVVDWRSSVISELEARNLVSHQVERDISWNLHKLKIAHYYNRRHHSLGKVCTRVEIGLCC